MVTAERIEQPWRESTAAITVLRGDELRAPTLGDALRVVPGFQLIAVNPGAPPMISSRGFFGAGEVEYVQLLIDGVPIGDVESGLADWRSIPIEAIDHIEIVRGAGSSLFGDTALGGVVQVFRKRASHVSFSEGSFDATRWSAAYASVDGWVAGATHARSHGFRAHGGSEEIFANFAMGAFTLDASHRDREDPGARSAEEMERDPFGSHAMFADDFEKSRRIRAAYRYRDLRLHAHRRHTDQTRTLLLAPGFGDRASRDLDTFAVGGSFLLSRFFGLEAEYAETRSVWTAATPVAAFHRRGKAAAFVTTEWRVMPRLRLALGARLDAIADPGITDRAFSPRLGASFDLGSVTAYAQLSRAFKAPTLEQRFDQRSIAGFTISNPALRAQHANNFEAGLRGVSWEIVGYLADVDDEIDFDVRTFRYANIGRSRHRGVESMFRGRFATLGYTWTRVEGADGHQLKNIAEHVARAGFDLRTFADIHLEIEHSAGRWLDDANQFPLDDATVVDVRIAKNIGSITAAIEATNLLDRRYAPLGFALGDAPYYYPAPRRSIAVSFTWKGDPVCTDCSSSPR